MAYYLTVEKGRINGKEEYEKLDITKCNCFPIPRFSKNLKGIGMTEEEFDYVSMQFTDEDEFRKYLLYNGILDIKYADRKLTLRQQRNGNLEKVRHGFLYQKDMEYILNPNKIIKRINDKLWVEKDFRFVDSLVNNYFNFRECGSTAPEVRCAVKESIRTGNISNMFTMRDENGDDLLTRMIKLLIYEYYQNADGKTHYVKRIDGDEFIKVYCNLHSVIAFVNNYDKKYNNKEEDSLKEVPSSDIAPMIQPVTASKPLTRTLSRKKGSKKYVLDEQMSIFNEK